MIKIEKTEVFGWEAAVRGMRNPMNSWEKSDSYNIYDRLLDFAGEFKETGKVPEFNKGCVYIIGENDLKLMKNLSSAGSDHGKFLRMINVTVDITAPLYWWKEFDTYKVGTVANSCSTMHKIHAKEFTFDDFSTDRLIDFSWNRLADMIEYLNECRKKFLETNDKEWWWQMIQLLPSSYNQKRTVQFNYQVLKAMYYARKNHKLDEWREFCEWCETLPYFKEICLGE